MNVRLYEYIMYENNKRISFTRINEFKSAIDNFIEQKKIFDKEISKKPMKIKESKHSDNGRFHIYSFVKCDHEIDGENLINNKNLEPIDASDLENIEDLGISKEDFLVIDVKDSRILLSSIFNTTQKALNMLKSFNRKAFMDIKIKNIIDEEFINNLTSCKSIEFKSINNNAFQFNDDLKETEETLKKISNSYGGSATKVKIKEPSKIDKIKSIFKNNSVSNIFYTAEISNDNFNYIFNSEKATLSISINLTKTSDMNIKLTEILEFLEKKL